MIRPGSLFYGDVVSLDGPYKRILSFETYIASIHHFPKGSTVGYGSTVTLSQNSTLANLPVGYADGYPLINPEKDFYVLIHGQYARVIGLTSMNTIMVDVTEVPDVKAGDTVVLFGSQEGEEITTEHFNTDSENWCRHCPVWGMLNPRYYIPALMDSKPTTEPEICERESISSPAVSCAETR